MINVVRVLKFLSVFFQNRKKSKATKGFQSIENTNTFHEHSKLISHHLLVIHRQMKLFTLTLQNIVRAVLLLP